MRRIWIVLAVAAVALDVASLLWLSFDNRPLGLTDGPGYSAAGRCFVGKPGAYTEIDCDTWRRARIHLGLELVLHPLAILGGGYLAFSVVIPAVKSVLSRRTASREANTR